MNALLVANFLATLAIFISLPITSMVLLQRFDLSASWIGAIGAIWPGTVFLGSFYFGSVLDRLGYRLSILIGMAICSLGFSLAAFASTPWYFSLAMVLFGVGKTFFDSSIRAAFSAISKPEARAKVFRNRYLVLNIASVVGPLAGAFLFPWLSWGVLLVTAAVYGLVWVISLIFLPSENQPRTLSKEKFRLSGHHLLLQSRPLLFWVVSTTLILAVYGGYETLMPLVAGKTSNDIPIMGFLLSLNSGVVILMQLLPSLRANNQNELYHAKTGFLGLIVGFTTLAIFYSTLSGLIVGTVFFSVGEALLFPCFETLLDRLAPEGKKASYFAIGEVKQIGFLIGPSIGGILYDWGGASILFGSFALFCFISAFAFIRSRVVVVAEI